ncbi:hypothetical protein BpHYR1_029704 [Brachionus plicatilis]|uniref:Uncharacterized protein n=1 Tax=Brachionus plicatilis TaxID=10195 RepID=A0A3M7T409_BRAPC|nr:hypothetical protein BpHYR1_029704 [Brachionus plicatilis]
MDHLFIEKNLVKSSEFGLSQITTYQNIQKININFIRLVFKVGNLKISAEVNFWFKYTLLNLKIHD